MARGRHIRHDNGGQRNGALRHVIMAAIAVVVVVALAVGIGMWRQRTQNNAANGQTSASKTSAVTKSDTKTPSASETTQSTEERAASIVNSMSTEEQVGQLVMAPLFAGSDASSISATITEQHVGSVLIIGNWNTGAETVRQATKQLQSYAAGNSKLIIATDQEGGSVQHLTGTGFDTMPSAVQQGTMTVEQLQKSAATWGSQLNKAGINVDLAPVLGTVTVNRDTNAPVGALNRDFGLDAKGNADHGIAFVKGMRESGVETSIKHYPGLGSVTGNTDFTTQGILDTTTTLDGEEIGAFDRAIREVKPSMVMMALATYQAIDPNNPAVFSSKIVNDHIRGDLGYNGVVISDSMSAAALGGVQASELGVRLVEAGGDIACIGDSTYVQPILNGLNAKAKSDPTFASKVKQSAQRVIALKINMGLMK